MREPESLKLLIPWIENACDNEHYPGLMTWIDKHRKIFFLLWVHKSSENWKETMSKVFEDWAAYKAKLGEKDARDLKAAFRNALRSKKNLILVNKDKGFRHWQITDESTETTSAPLATTTNRSSRNKITKQKQKRGPKKGTRRCYTKKIEARNDFQSGSGTNSIDIPVPAVVNCTQSSTILYTPNNESAVTNPLPSYNSVFTVSPPTPPLQQTDVFLKTLVEQSDFFGIQDSERMSSPCFRTSSPVVIPNSLEIPETASPISNVNNDIRMYSSFYDLQQHSKNFPPSPDYFLQTVNEVNKEQVVPTPNFDLWNYDFSVEQPQIVHEIQLDSKQKEMELEAACQLRLDQTPMYNLGTEVPLSVMTEFMPGQQMLSNDMDDDIFRYLWDIPEMTR